MARGMLAGHCLYATSDYKLRAGQSEAVCYCGGMKTPIDIARLRENRIARGLTKIATRHGVTLRGPLHIDANGEFSVVASNGTDKDGPNDPCGKFKTFAAVLNMHNPRCGIAPGAVLLPESGWCRLNHFDAENLVTTRRQSPPRAQARRAAPPSR